MNNNETDQIMSVGGITFMIRIQFRQNASWQGSIQWLEEKKTRVFRSELELLMLINEAVEASKLHGSGDKLGSWEKASEVS